jgi:hypothetical protein
MKWIDLNEEELDQTKKTKQPKKMKDHDKIFQSKKKFDRRDKRK